ncbi:MAG: 6,7-dimethyl-8-ribityllumazine synthase [Phenylobacterium sp.]|uniref:6,7-dimethyl-8-ribityllumazine synthase n=1 Tax=Phenylobacterium sp. TaxID=1871053 RepID=UPI0025FDC15D|nr:6,7-dimethyl-8-ribityllumazine synthase [Phenylobacterium sp.]MBI1198094.1 6,7-dimethyl-8-ribityllumazine synthase [Phenylobacterium sp.]
MSDEPLRLLIVEARFYDGLADALLDGATQALAAFGAEYDVVSVPGALEIPAAIAFAEEGGHRPAGKHYDGYLALGAVIAGEAFHFEIVAAEAVRGLMDLSVGRRLCIGSGVVTCEDEDQAWAMARTSEGDKGGAAAQAALSMIALKQQLMGGKR